MSVRVSLRGMLRLIRVDTLRRVHNVGFLVDWVINMPFSIEHKLFQIDSSLIHDPWIIY